MARSKKQIDLNNLTPEDKLKLEIAEEIGVYDKVIAGGWRVLSAKESGKIGGLINSRKKALRQQDSEE